MHKLSIDGTLIMKHCRAWMFHRFYCHVPESEFNTCQILNIELNCFLSIQSPDHLHGTHQADRLRPVKDGSNEPHHQPL